MSDTIMVTEFSEFYKATAAGETRYYPITMRNAALSFDAGAVAIKGHGVYDTNVSTDFAVMVTPDRATAESHKPAETTKAPTSAVDDDDEDFGVALGTGPHLEEEDAEAEEKPKKPPAKRASRRKFGKG